MASTDTWFDKHDDDDDDDDDDDNEKAHHFDSDVLPCCRSLANPWTMEWMAKWTKVQILHGVYVFASSPIHRRIQRH